MKKVIIITTCSLFIGFIIYVLTSNDYVFPPDSTTAKLSSDTVVDETVLTNSESETRQNTATEVAGDTVSEQDFLETAVTHTETATRRIRNSSEIERRPPPTRTSEVLSEPFFRDIAETQKYMVNEQWAEAIEKLNTLYQGWDEMNDFEKSTLLNFYTNLFISKNMYPETILTFETMLGLPTLRPDIELRALKALGQLNMAEENYTSSIEYFNRHLESSEGRDNTVVLGLANSYNSLEDYSNAIPLLTEHIETLQANEEDVSRGKYLLLRSMSVQVQDLDAAIRVSQQMIDDFNEPEDWQMLGSLYEEAGEPELQQALSDQASALGYRDADGVWFHER